MDQPRYLRSTTPHPGSEAAVVFGFGDPCAGFPALRLKVDLGKKNPGEYIEQERAT